MHGWLRWGNVFLSFVRRYLYFPTIVRSFFILRYSVCCLLKCIALWGKIHFYLFIFFYECIYSVVCLCLGTYSVVYDEV